MFELVQPTTLNTVTILLSLFMVLFMLGSDSIQNRLFLGQVPVALLVSVIFGPDCARLIDPLAWSNARAVTFEFTRVILAIQCFGNAIELPRRYMQRAWKSLAWIIGPVMLCGWFVSTCCVKLMAPSFGWRQALACAACFNAIDPVLAQAVLSGSFARRVPKHLRDLLRAEAAANGVTTTLVLDLMKYLLREPGSPRKIAIRFFSIALPYEVLFSTVSGVLIGYAARRGLRKAHEQDAVDRQSFLAYYLSVALFGLGFGALLGVDEVNLCFFAGVGLDNDNWYEEKTEQTFLASCVDLVLNLSYFVFIGSLVPWRSFNSEALGIEVWRLVLGTICIFLFRRLPILMLFKSVIPDIKTWREAAFYGHFGPIGAGALFSALIIGAEPIINLGSTLDRPERAESQLYQQQLWVVATFVFVASSIVHGSSIALFTLGRHVNTLTLTMSYTAANEPNWMDRLPRIQSRSNSDVESDASLDEPVQTPGMSPTTSRWSSLHPAVQTDDPDCSGGQSSSRHSSSRLGWRTWDGPGSSASESAIAPHSNATRLPTVPEVTYANSEPRRGPVRAYQFGNTIILEDEDGEVIKKYDIPSPSSNADHAGPSRPLSSLRSSNRRLTTREFIEELRSVAPENDIEVAGTDDDSTNAQAGVPQRRSQGRRVRFADDLVTTQ